MRAAYACHYSKRVCGFANTQQLWCFHVKETYNFAFSNGTVDTYA